MLQQVNERVKVTNPENVADVLRAILKAESEVDQDKEHWWVMGMNTRNVIKYVDLVALGILDSCLCHPRETFRLAVLKGVSSIIIAHNHPSADPEPSEEDKKITVRMVEAGKIIGIEVLDHVIISNRSEIEGFTSLKARGLLNI